MGYDIDFYKKQPDGTLKYDESDVPESFGLRYEGRQAWQFAMLDVPYEDGQTCSCNLNIDGKHYYGCCEAGAWRPADFAAFKELLKARGLWRKPFRCMTRWLERHPDVFIGFNN